MELEQLLTTKGLTIQSSAEDILKKMSDEGPKHLNIFYGETYDEYGSTIDSMKYYFFVSALAKALQNKGHTITPTILIADSAACRNVSEKHIEKYQLLGEQRAEFVRKVNNIYDLKLIVKKMSEYIDSEEFIRARAKVIEICKNDPQMMLDIEKTVPQSKLDIERKKGFLYSFDEITTILDVDIKIGPPREDLYDSIARRIVKEKSKKSANSNIDGPNSLFLNPTYPLGMNWGYFFSIPGIEDHGITAYKAGSKQLQEKRIILDTINHEKIRELIFSSFISINPALPNPILDVGIIAKLAKNIFLKQDDPITLFQEFYNGNISPAALKELVYEDVNKHILSRLSYE